MDRVLVEVLITVSLLSLSAVITTSASLTYTRLKQFTEELSYEKALYSLAGAIKGAVVASIISGNNVSTSISFHNPVTIEAEGEFLKVYLMNSVRLIYLGVMTVGGGCGRVFYITASENLVFLTSNP
ncbi:MAG: hypothetical protein H5T34_06310 [Candidatus Methanomethyliales bacterium]|nr:hypothetical protein [Candidatus Methanomethylicales archaeon]